MKRFFRTAAMVTSLAISSAATTPVLAGDGDLGAGLIGGLAIGTIIGAAATAPRYYPPPPVYVAPPRRTAIGRAENQSGMVIEAYRLILQFGFVNNLGSRRARRAGSLLIALGVI